MVSYFSRLRRRRSRGIEGVLRADGREGKGIKRSGIMTKPIIRKSFTCISLSWHVEVVFGGEGKTGCGDKRDGIRNKDCRPRMVSSSFIFF